MPSVDNTTQTTAAVTGGTSASENPGKRRTKNLKRSLEESQRDFMLTSTKALSENHDISEFDAVGISVAKRLQRMDPEQAMYAEEIINKVLRKGLLNKLSENTEL